MNEYEKINCAFCGKIFIALRCRNRKYCSIKCKSNNRINLKMSWRWKKKLEEEKCEKTIKEAHLKTMFVGDYAEGEIL